MVLILFLVVPDAGAQVREFSFRDMPLSDALVRVSEDLDEALAFDAGRLGRITVRKDISGADISSVLAQLLDGTGFSYRLKNGTYLIVPLEGTAETPDEPETPLLRATLYDGMTMEPLPMANVYLAGQGHLLHTSENGSFAFRQAHGEPVRLVISHIGYQSVDTVLVGPAQDGEISIRLRRRVLPIEPVDVRAVKNQAIRSGPEAGHTEIRPARMASLPGFGETDIFGVLGLLPGISYAQNSSDLIIRGGYGDQNLVLFDGFTLYSLDHFFGSFSSINPGVVGDMQVYKGGYGPRYGERVSGIVDISGKSGDSLAPSVLGGINLLSANLAAEIPVGKKIRIVAGARKGYSSIFSNFLIENLYEDNSPVGPGLQARETASVIEPDYGFYDVNFKLSYDPDDDQKISVTAFTGKDFLEISDQSDRRFISAEITDRNRWSNFGIGTTWDKKWSAAYRSVLQAGGSGYDNAFESRAEVTDKRNVSARVPETRRSALSIDESENNRLSDYYISLRNYLETGGMQRFEFGASVRNNLIDYANDGPLAYTEENPVPSSMLFSLYVQDEIRPFKGMAVRPGLRVNHFSVDRKLYAEPRLSATYTTASHTVFKLAAGRYFQYINKITSDQSYGYNRDLWVFSGRPGHPVLESGHLIAGSIFRLGPMKVDAEAWYKDFRGLQKLMYITGAPEQGPGIRDYHRQAGSGSDSANAMILTGNGRSYGVDVLLYYTRGRYSGWFSYSLGRAIQNFEAINGGLDIPAPYDRPWSVDWTHMFRIGKWNLSALWVYTAGQPVIVFDVNNENLEEGRLYRRLPDYRRLDASANYSFTIGKVYIRTGLSVINLLDKQNYYDLDRRNFIFDNTSIEETSIIRSRGITPNLYLHFRF